MKKVLVVGPILTRSGYGEHTRFVVDSLLSKPELYDVYLYPLSWGATSWSYEHDYKREAYEFLIQKREAYTGEFDLSVQVTVPNEFQAFAPINIGVTAGVETTTVPQEWITRCNSMDKIIVTSEYTKSSFDNTTFELKAAQNDETKKFTGCMKPIEVVSYPIRSHDLQSVEDGLSCVKTPFNFLTIAQMAPRKNLEQTISCFIDEFRDDENVGLILKTHAQNHSTLDKDLTETMLFPAIRRCGERKCKVYHIHGDMKDEEITGLISSPKVNAYYTTTFAEGFGLPIFDAVSAGVPVIAPKFSGHLDFLHIPRNSTSKKKDKDYLFESIYTEAGEIPKHCLMDGILLEGAKWGYPNPDKTKKALRNVYTNYRAKTKQALRLQEYVNKTFTQENQFNKMLEAIRTGYENESVEWKENMAEIQVL